MYYYSQTLRITYKYMWIQHIPIIQHMHVHSAGTNACDMHMYSIHTACTVDPLKSGPLRITDCSDYWNIQVCECCYDHFIDQYASVNRSLDYPSNRVRGAHIFKSPLYCTVLTSGVITNVRWCLLSRKYCWILFCKKVGDLSNSCNTNPYSRV